MKSIPAICFLAFFNVLLAAAPAQEQSVRPGINDTFENPDVSQFVERWESEGREIYDLRQQILDTLQLQAGQDVADIGCGTGLFTRIFSTAVGTAGSVYAVDISDEFLEHINKHCKQAGVVNVTTVLCQQDDVLLKPDSIDLAFLCDTYHHFEFPFKSMASIDKALRPDGRLVVIDFHRIPGQSSDFILGHVRADQKTVREEIESCGFELTLDKQGLLKENYLMVFRKK